MVALTPCFVRALGLAAAVSLVGCSAYSRPQVADDGRQQKMTPEQAQKAKAEANAKGAKDYEAAMKRFNVHPNVGKETTK